MNKEFLIQSLLSKANAKSYLEIGIENGHCFFSIDAKVKVGIDPVIRKNVRQRNLKNIFKNLFSKKTEKLYQETSDSFFENKVEGMTFDLIFIDGLHTYKQSLKDVLNSLQCLNDGGIIVLHDCNPTSESMGHPAESYEDLLTKNISSTDEWCGDVWKTIVHLRSMRDDLNVVVMDCDYGVGIIRKCSPDSMLSYNHNELNSLTYSDLASYRKELLNLKEIEYFETYLSLLKQSQQNRLLKK